MLLKPTHPVFVPGIPGREFRPYSRECPVRYPPSPPPAPGVNCQTVPIYGPSSQGTAGGPSEGGAGGPTIVGYQTVCSDGTSTSWGIDGGSGGGDRPPPTPVSTNSVSPQNPVVRSVTYFRQRSLGYGWFQFRMALAGTQQTTEGAWVMAYQVREGQMPAQALRSEFPTVSAEYSPNDAAVQWMATECTDLGVLTDGSGASGAGQGIAPLPMKAPSGPYYITGVLVRAGDPAGLLLDYVGLTETPATPFATPLIPTRTFPRPRSSQGISVTDIPFDKNVTVTGVAGTAKYYVAKIPYKNWRGRLQLTAAQGSPVYGNAWIIAATMVTWAPLLGAYPPDQAPGFEIIGQTNRGGEISGQPPPQQRLTANTDNYHVAVSLFGETSVPPILARADTVTEKEGQDIYVIVGVMPLGTATSVTFKVSIAPP